MPEQSSSSASTSMQQDNNINSNNSSSSNINISSNNAATEPQRQDNLKQDPTRAIATNSSNINSPEIRNNDTSRRSTPQHTTTSSNETTAVAARPYASTGMNAVSQTNRSQAAIVKSSEGGPGTVPLTAKMPAPQPLRAPAIMSQQQQQHSSVNNTLVKTPAAAASSSSFATATPHRQSQPHIQGGAMGQGRLPPVTSPATNTVSHATTVSSPNSIPMHKDSSTVNNNNTFVVPVHNKFTNNVAVTSQVKQNNPSNPNNSLPVAAQKTGSNTAQAVAQVKIDINPSDIPVFVSSPLPDSDVQILEEKRTPLTHRYGSFIAPSDTCVNDARERLRTALKQCRDLRQSFTERVYEKYKVCLVPPSELSDLYVELSQDPAATYQRLCSEINSVQKEKESEKKQAQQLNASWVGSEAATQLNVEHAEQLMFYSAGLSCIILPEHKMDDKLANLYIHRAPINPETGQRCKGLSHAAATAGQIMLDRTRQAVALCLDRQQPVDSNSQQQDNPAQTTIVGSVVNSAMSEMDLSLTVAAAPHVIKPSILFQAAPKKAKAENKSADKTQKGSASASLSDHASRPLADSKKRGKNRVRGRGRQSSALHATLIQGLHPEADCIVLPNLGRTSASKALQSRKVGNQQKVPMDQHRLPVPLENSQYARDKAHPTTSAAAAAVVLDTTDNRIIHVDSKIDLSSVLKSDVRSDESRSNVDRLFEKKVYAVQSIKAVTDCFDTSNDIPRRSTTKIGLMNHIRSRSESVSNSNEEGKASSLDRIMTFCVLHSVGLIRHKTKRTLTPDTVDELEDILVRSGNDSVNKRRKVVLNSSHSRLALLSSTRTDYKLSNFSDSDEFQCKTRTSSPPILHIRGGGGGENDMSDSDNIDSSGATNNSLANNSRSTVQNVNSVQDSQGSIQRPVNNFLPNRQATSIPMFASNMSPPSAVNQLTPTRLSRNDTVARDQMNHDQTLNALHLANQLRYSNTMSPSIHHPAGDIASSMYFQNLHHHQQQQQQYGVHDATNFFHGKSPHNAPIQAQLPLNTASPNQVISPLGTNMPFGNMPRDPQTVAFLRNYSGHTANSQYAQMNVHPITTIFTNTNNGTPAIPVHPQGFPTVNNLTGVALHASLLSQQQSEQQMFANALQSQRSSQSDNVSVSSQNPSAQPRMSSKPTIGLERSRSSSLASESSSKQVKSPARARKQSDASHQSDVNIEKKTEKVVKAPNIVGSSPKNMEKTDVVTLNSALPSQNEQQKLFTPTVTSPSSKVAVASQNERVRTKGPSESTISVSTRPALVNQGLLFVHPVIPQELTNSQAVLIRQGRFFDVVDQLKDDSERTAALKYLQDVATAIPIPSTFIANQVRDKLSSTTLKQQSKNLSFFSASRDAITVCILIWLWATHESIFQRAFDKNGRIDVDNDCKWIIQAATDTAIKEVTQDIADATARNDNIYSEAGSNVDLKSSSGATLSKQWNLRMSTVISRVLMTELELDTWIDSCLENIHDHVSYLEEARLCALKEISKERALLANLVAQNLTMSDTFSQAYTSSVIRAGIALGHAQLFEEVQDEKVMVSSMIPYDIFQDEALSWEEPCRPEGNFNPGLTGEEILRRAHARALLNRSLRRLQDRHNLQGGTPHAGPYAMPSKSAQVSSARVKSDDGPKHSSPKPVAKKRSSVTGEPKLHAGTGSAEARSWNVYNSATSSDVLFWNTKASGNLPYGRCVDRDNQRSPSALLSGIDGRNAKRLRRSLDTSIPGGSSHGLEKGSEKPLLQRSTFEIDWVDIAETFQRVEAPTKPSHSRSSDHDAHSHPVVIGSKIFAPYCKFKDEETITKELKGGLDSESDTEEEEDLSDETVIQRHQEVLDEMKAKMAAYVEARKRQQERKRGRSSK